MEEKVDFRTHKEYLLSSWMKEKKKKNCTAVDFVLHEPVRIFIWSLVQSLQEYHLIEECPIKVRHKNIVVCGHRGFIMGDCNPYDEQRALDNYKKLRKFLIKHLFGDYVVADLPHCVTHFLSLLVDQPLAKLHLIAWHVGHLSTAYTICFINNIAYALISAKPEDRAKIRLSIDAVDVDQNWESRFVHEYAYLMVKFVELRSKKGACYNSVDQSGRSYFLVQFLHFVVDHAGVERRTTFKAKHFMEWIRTSNAPDSVKDRVLSRKKGKNKEPVKLLNDLIHDIFILFQQFLTDLQFELYKQGVLEVVSPCPDEILHF